MSRSRKKPYLSITGGRAGEMAEWRTYANGKVRRIPITEELPNGSSYKKITDNWTSPQDGRKSLPKDIDPRYTRK